MVNALPAMVPVDAMTLVPLLLTMSRRVGVTAVEPEVVSATLEKDAEPKSANVD
jgi:hypothetical protein